MALTFYIPTPQEVTYYFDGGAIFIINDDGDRLLF